MATFGAALAALDDFRTNLLHERLTTTTVGAQAMAFRGAAGLKTQSPFGSVHATGVGVRGGDKKPGEGDFVIKVYVFDESDVQTVQATPFLKRKQDGVDVDVEYLPIQVAYVRAKRKKAVVRAPAKKKPRARAADTPEQHQKHIRPVPAGVEIGPLGGNFVGTIGCFVRRGAGDAGPLFVLSNNHVLADVNRFPLGTRFTQPFSADPGDVIATLSDFEPIRFPELGSQPRNVIDAAIASVTDPSQVVLGRMLNIPNFDPQLLAPRPGMAVTKSGRTTGVTTGMIRAIRVRGVQINYGTQQAPIIATFDNAITITGSGGTPFSNPGDSGSVILEQQSGRPVALLFAGDGRTTTACDVAAACARFNVHPV
jgi:hypothetical protein